MSRAMLIVNPTSGGEKSLDYQDRLHVLLKEKGYDAVIETTEKAFDATEFARNACTEEYDLVIAMGGDGTINEVINGFAEQPHRPKFGFIPLGTVNDFARAIGLPMDAGEAIEVIAEENNTRLVDIGKVNDQYFMNIIAIGSIAEATFQVSIDQKTKLGPLAYVLEGAKALAGDASFQVTFHRENEEFTTQSMLVLIALTNSVGGFEKLAPDAEVDDGKLHIFSVNELSALDVMKVVTSVLRGEFENDENTTYIEDAKITVAADETLTANIDGEEGFDLPLDVKVLPKHLEIIVP